MECYDNLYQKIYILYENIFGKPGTGIHSIRIANIAILDILVTLVIAYGLCLLFPRVPKYIFFVGIFIVGIVVHRLFCVRTTVDKFLFPHVTK